MGIRELKLKWAQGMCRGKPAYVSNNRILIPSDFFMKTCDVTGNNIQYHFEPKIKIGCCCSLPELGIIAVSERKTNGVIYILDYPNMSNISVLEQISNEPYSALSFVGLELLISLHVKNCYEIDLWKWSSAERVHFLSIPVLQSRVPEINLLPNPLWWYQMILQCNERMMLLEVKQSEDRYFLGASRFFFSSDEENRVELSIEDEPRVQKNVPVDPIKPMLDNLMIQSVCWLPENNMLVATFKWFLKVEISNFTVYKIAENKTVVSSMILCKPGLFIGYKTGYIDIVSIVGHRWHLVETINIDQPINNLFSSPDYNILTLTTLKGSIFYCKMNERLSFNILLRSEFGDEVGVNFLGLLSQLCVTAKRNGFIHIFRTIDGKALSTFQLSEEIVSLATSPLSYCIVVGTNVGFIYFIDVTDVQKPKIVHCERPYEIPINHLKFDNFGRFLVASTQNQPIKIWNGLPSSGFALLGSKKVTTQVKDFAIFCRKQEDDDTVLLILSESGSCSDKETGDMLIRLKLPPDFCHDPQKYQIDVFGTLSGDALNFQKKRLDKPCCKIDVHLTLGAIFYSSKTHKVYDYLIWSDFSNAKLNDISPQNVKNISFMCVSIDQQWITLTDLNGNVYISCSKEFKTVAESERYYAAESVCKSFIDFSHSSDRIICGRENGDMLYFQWEEDSKVLKSLPEWVIYCYSKFDGENCCLHSMEEVERLELVLQVNETSHYEPYPLHEICEKLEMWTFVLNFHFDKLLQEKVSEELTSNVFNSDYLEKIFSDNRKNLPCIASEILKIEDTSNKSDRENSTKVISSFSQGFTIEDYAVESINTDSNIIIALNSHSDKAMKMPIPNWSFIKSVKMKTKEERRKIITELIEKECDLKLEFNEEFDALFQMKPNISIRSGEEMFSAKMLTINLPSKAERDFWGATLIERNYKKHLENVESKDICNGDQESKQRNEDDIQKAKRSIELHAKSSQNIEEKFDYDVEMLALKKRYCDCKIFIYEVRIHSILLFAKEEEIFAAWREEVENEIKYLEVVQSQISGFLKETSDLEKVVKDLYFVLEREERNKSYKIGKKCNKMANANAYSILKKQPTLQLSDKSQNPFWCPYSSINPDLRLVTKDLFPNPFEDESRKTEWLALCNKQMFVLKVGAVMRNLQNQLIELTSVKHSCTYTYLRLKMNKKVMQRSVKYMELVLLKCKCTFDSLLTTKLESFDLGFEGDPKSKRELSVLNSVDSSNSTIWENIDLEVGRVKGIQDVLQRIGNIFDRCSELKVEMRSKCKFLQNEYVKKMKELRGTLGCKKQNFASTRCVADEILEQNKKTVFDILKIPSFNKKSATTV